MCHKSYLINIKKVTDFIKTDGGTIVLDKTIQVPISQDKKEEFLKLMQLFSI
jgi:two-component system LytT family response regulator